MDLVLRREIPRPLFAWLLALCLSLSSCKDTNRFDAAQCATCRTVHIAVVEKTPNDPDGLLEPTAEALEVIYGKEFVLRATNVEEMADLAAEKAASLRPYDEIVLDLVGHGAPGRLGMGAGIFHEPTEVLDASARVLGPATQPLKSLFKGARGSVRLFGCAVGRGTEGQIFQYAFAQAVRVPVYASLCGVSPDGFTKRLLKETPDWMRRIDPSEPLRLVEDGPDTTRACLQHTSLQRPFPPGSLDQARPTGISELFPTAKGGVGAGASRGSVPSIRALLSHFDQDHTYSGRDLLASRDAILSVDLRDGEIRLWSFVMGFRGLLIPSAQERALLLAHPGSEEQILRWIRELEEAQKRLTRDPPDQGLEVRAAEAR